MKTFSFKKPDQILIENRLLPLALFFSAFILRLCFISKGYYQGDCFYLGLQAQKILETGQMHYLHLLGYPATALLGALFLAIGSVFAPENPAFSINLIGVVFSSLSLVALYFIVKKLIDTLTAFLSVILIMVHPAFLAVSVFGNSHMPFLFFFFLSILELIRFREKGAIRHLLTSSVFAGLMLANRPQEIIHFITLSFLFWAPVSARFIKKGSFKHYFFYWATASVTTILFYLPLIHKTLSANRMTAQIQSSLSVSRFVAGNFSQYAFAVTTPAILKSFTIAGALLLLAGSFILARKKPLLFSFLLTWLIPPLLFYASLVTTVPRYHLNIIVPLAIILCYGISCIIRYNRLSLMAGAVVFGILASVLFSGIYPIINFRHHHDLMKEYGEWIMNNTEPSAIIYSQEDGFIIEHFANRVAKKPPFQDFAQNKQKVNDRQLISMTREAIKGSLHSGIPVYATTLALFSNDRQYRFKKLIEKHFMIKPVAQTTMEEWHQGSTNLILYREKLYKIGLK